ncbi:hypothetical protein [Flavobacterium sp. I3-2]|uniref:hypothetical protein n=1 Tax=Flavobacterium sp. I3-2 TaxID=2748319 RepID=UPI0015B2783E|nr:hypothetical protein [Flavobacterium sp. I3-2]
MKKMIFSAIAMVAFASSSKAQDLYIPITYLPYYCLGAASAAATELNELGIENVQNSNGQYLSEAIFINTFNACMLSWKGTKNPNVISK